MFVVIAPSPGVWYLEVRIKGLLKMEALYRSKCWHVREPPLIKAITAKHESTFVALTDAPIYLKYIKGIKKNIKKTKQTKYQSIYILA
jgi:hypothetical protein